MDGNLSDQELVQPRVHTAEQFLLVTRQGQKIHALLWETLKLYNIILSILHPDINGFSPNPGLTAVPIMEVPNPLFQNARHVLLYGTDRLGKQAKK